MGRTRGTRSGGVDLTPTWRNCILTTGESPLTGSSAGAGAVNRVIDVECRAGAPVIRDGMRVASLLKRNYGFAGRKFVERLYRPGVTDELQGRYQALFKELSDRDTTEKQAMAAAAILLGDQLACGWIFPGESPLTVREMGEFLASKAAVSAGLRGYQYLCGWVTQNSGRLCGRSDNGQEVYGAMDDIELPSGERTAARAYIVRPIFERVLTDAGFSPASTLSYLKQNGLIECRGRAYTKGKRINGVLTECVCMRLPTEQEENRQIDEEIL